jgi:hypothetical protein
MVRQRASRSDAASSDGILAIARQTQGGRHRVGDIWTATGSSSRARSQSETMINLNPRSADPCLGRRQRVGVCGAFKCNNTVCPGGVEQLQRLHCRIHWRSPESRPPAPRDVQDYPAEIASPLVFLAPDESPQLVHGSGHAAHGEPTNFVLPPSRPRGAEHCASTKSAVHGLVRGLQLGRVT